MSACRATRRSSTFSPPPPIRIGGCGWRTGFGSQYTLAVWKCLPAKLGCSSVHICFISVAASSSCRSRIRSGGKSNP